MLKKYCSSRPLALIVPAVFLLFAMFSACEKKVDRIVEVQVHDTTTVTQTDTVTQTVHDTITVSVIGVDTLIANPDSIAQGGSVTLTATVTKRPEVGNITLYWYANGGSFDKVTGDTVVWKAPAEPDVYEITVHATDGKYIGIGSRLVGVGMYAPTVTPYYISVERCRICHPAKNTEWETTGHADAWATLMASDHAGPSCFQCHSVGYEGPKGNGGFDEVPIAKFENVQCENCHGAGSDHFMAEGQSPLNTSLGTPMCGICHDGTHHPYLTQWKESAHNLDPRTWDGGMMTRSGSCRDCHEGAIAAQRLSQPDPNVLIGAAAIAPTDSAWGITCSVCHDPHDGKNVGQLRTTADVNFVSGETASGHGAGQLCMQCHHARRGAEEQIPSGNAHFGPHPGTQGDVVYGTTGYTDVNPNKVFVSSGHGLIQDACAACHVYRTDFDAVTNFANVGHTFAPRVEACQNCHGTGLTSFDQIMAKQDYDNDGDIEGLQTEVVGLMDLLAEKLVEADTTVGDTLMGTDPTPEVVAEKLAGTNGNTSALAVKLREAGWNLVLALDDNSKGIHNPAYIVQLLQQSILFLDPNALPPSVQLTDSRATTFTAQKASIK